MPVNITFRTQLQGGVSDFCHDSKLPLLANNMVLVELVVMLARYQEEGVPLCPRVYLTDDIQKLSRMMPGGERYKIGSASPDAVGLRAAVKKCAPLATGDWMLYVQDGQPSIEYGVFKGESNPVSVLVDDILFDGSIDGIVVKASQIATDCVEVRCNNGKKHFVFLNHRHEDSPPPLQFLDNLIAAITDLCPPELKDPAASYLTRLLFESLRQSHCQRV